MIGGPSDNDDNDIFSNSDISFLNKNDTLCQSDITHLVLLKIGAKTGRIMGQLRLALCFVYIATPKTQMLIKRNSFRVTLHG